MDNKQIVIEGIKRGDSKMKIVCALIRNDAELDTSTAGTLYTTTGTEAELLMTNKEKDEAVNGGLVPFIIIDAATKIKTLDRIKAMTAILTKYPALDKGAINSRFKKYCADNEIELPVISLKRDMALVEKTVSEWRTAGHAEPAIKAGLVRDFNFSEGNVDAAYRKIGKALGFISDSSYRTALAVWCQTASNVAGSKKEVIAKMVEHFGIAAATADFRYTMYLFALDFQKAAISDSQPVEQAA